MTHPKPRKLFFAGTDTDVGKTYVAALMAKLLRQLGKRVGVYKPVASGCRQVDGGLVAEDAVALWESAGCPLSLDAVCPQRFTAPLAPPEAAAAEHKKVDVDLLINGIRPWEEAFEVVLVEGAGGLFSPLADGMLNVDLFGRLNAELVIVAANRLGVIHQTLAVCDAAAHRGLQPRGIVLCDPNGNADESASSNAAQIARYSHVRVLGSVPFQGQVEDVRFLEALLD